MSELEPKIAAWRTRLLQALPGEEETVRELESHLRDHLESLLRRGMVPDEAFAASVQRLGEVHADEAVAARHEHPHALIPARIWSAVSAHETGL